MGGSAWELKIDTERLQDKENNDLEEESETRSETSTYITAGKWFPKQVFNLRSFFFVLERWRGLDGGSAVGGRRSDVP